MGNDSTSKKISVSVANCRFVTTVSNELIYCRYSNVARETLLFTVSNGNTVTYNIFLCLYNSSEVQINFLMLL
jgi:hypothetical protein